VNVRRILANHGIEADVTSSGTTAFVYLRRADGMQAAVRALAPYEQFEVLRKDALPPYARLGNGPRVPPLIISARPPYFIEDPQLWPWWLAWLGDWGPEFMWARLSLKASHGYPPQVPGMAGILYAWGAGIAAGRQVDAIDAVDLHPTVMHLLGIGPGQPVDGVVARGLLAE
jgi:hypothetical protein